MAKCIIATFVNVLVSSMALKCPGDVTYTLTWRGSWSTENHPNAALPIGAHFSNLIGCTHGSEYIMWRTGMMASPGVKLVAEEGQTGTLETEIKAQKTAGKVWQVILPGFGLGAEAEKTDVEVKVTPDYSKVSLISMLGPSPGWYVGIDSHDLCNDGQWRETWDVTMLPPYDSGTDSGLQFESSDQPTVPPQPIFRINNTMDGVFKAQNPIPSLGEFRFKRLNPPVIQINHSDSSAFTVMYQPTGTTKLSQTTTAPNDSASKDSIGLLLFISATFMLAWLY